MEFEPDPEMNPDEPDANDSTDVCDVMGNTTRRHNWANGLGVGYRTVVWCTWCRTVKDA
jgi:hypothetical protein